MQSTFKKYTEANRDAWNEVMPRHQKIARERWDNAFMQPGFVCLDEVELELLKQIGVEGKNVVHLCCNNGVELLSLKNLGANQCVGFDISDIAVQEATERAEQCQIGCQFIRSDVYEIGPEHENRFDMVYISVGCLGWMPDLKLFFEKAVGLLKNGGLIFIYETHPFLEMLPSDDSEEVGSLRIIEPYFKTEPYVEQGGLDYVGHSEYATATTHYWFVHKLSDILMGLIENRISIEHFSEYETDISAGHKRIEQAQAGIPLSYILIGRKQSAS